MNNNEYIKVVEGSQNGSSGVSEGTVTVTNTEGFSGIFNPADKFTPYRTPPKIVSTNVFPDRIEIIWRVNSITWPSNDIVYKIVYSCQDGKWHVSEPIYGRIIPPSPEETYVFD